jgi:hypothetical protein
MAPDPFVHDDTYADGFGNWCTRIVAPAGRLRLSANAVVSDTGERRRDRPVGAAARGGGSSR